MVNENNGNIKRKICTEKRINTSLKNLSIALNIHVGVAYVHFKILANVRFELFRVRGK